MNDVLSKLIKYNSILHIDNLFTWMMRNLGWAIVKLLCDLLNAVQGLIDGVLKLNTFFENPDLQSFIDEFRPILYLILAISIIFLGYQLMLNRKQKFFNLFNNIVLAICIIVFLPIFMIELNKIVLLAVNSTGSVSNGPIANKIVKDNIEDLLLYDSVNFDTTKLTDKNNIPVDYIMNIDITENIDTSFNKLNNSDLFKKKLTVDKDGNQIAVDLSKGFLGVGDENYYRFSVNFFTIIITLIVLSATYILSSIKIARIIFELAFYKFFAAIAAFADLSGGQKVKEIVKTIVNSFLVIFMISVVFKMYMIFTTWAVNNSSGLIYLILIIAGSFVVIDGPNIIERILGIDAGLRSSYKTVMGIYMGGKTAASMFGIGRK
ncbi:MAG: hypothetical protein FWC47_15745 [Oscillospiraceae bacterium]|nr:hypothetical protein [Oscillospiraceae bacterium]